MSKASKRTAARDTKREQQFSASAWRKAFADTEQHNRLLDAISQRLQNPAWDGLRVYGAPYSLLKPVSEDGSDRTFAHCG